jgi:hypothetical protein
MSSSKTRRIIVTAPGRAMHIYIMTPDGVIRVRKANTGFRQRGIVANPAMRRTQTLVDIAWRDGMRKVVK